MLYIGIDVGGTSTDAVLLDRGKVKDFAKIFNSPDNLLASLLEALDKVLNGVEVENIKRVVLSTTVITNLIAEQKQDTVGLILMPGPGRKLHQYRKTDVQIISGAIDYRGREIIPVNEEEVIKAVDDLAKKGHNKIGIVGKFSPRNNCHEIQVMNIVKKLQPNWLIEMGHTAGGQLNFPRRVANTLLKCATKGKYKSFVESVRCALKERNITAQVFVMKADGGTMTLDGSIDSPVETIFSGPAASTLGVQSLTPPEETSLVVDVGGTTTDLSLILSGQPLLASKGVMLGDQLTQVRALATRSVPIGGDSVLEIIGKELIIYSERAGRPYCMGGPFPTPTDALNVMGLTALGNKDKAWEAMKMLGDKINISPVDMARKAINSMVDMIVEEIDRMFVEWEREPAYRTWEVMQKRKVRPQNVVGVGGGAVGFIPKIAVKISGTPVLLPYAAVANAIGAAVSKPTLQVTLNADTEQKVFRIEETGLQGTIDSDDFKLDQAIQLAKDYLIKLACDMNINNQIDEIELIRKDVFNIVRNMVTTGKIYDICVQTERGIQYHVGAGR